MNKSRYMPVCNVPEVAPELQRRIRQQTEESRRAGHDFETYNAAIKRIQAEYAATAGRAA